VKFVVFDIETKNFFQDVSKRDPALLDISVVCTYNSVTDKYESFLEKDLSKLWPMIESTDALIGYNSDYFDIPLLNKYYHGDLINKKSIDLMKTIQNSLGRRIGLDAVIQATLGLKKTAHGSQAMEWWKQGEIQKVIDYCIQDVKVTRSLYEHMRDNNFVKYKDLGGEVVEIKVDTSDWGEHEDSGMTHSLQF